MGRVWEGTSFFMDLNNIMFAFDPELLLLDQVNFELQWGSKYTETNAISA